MEWYGWIWRGNAWQRVTGPHASLSECSRALSQIGKARRVLDKHQVMTGGAVPNFRPSDKRVSPAEQGRVE